MSTTYNRDCLQTPQPWRRHQPPVASVPTIGNLSGNDFGNISGNKIGKNGNAVRPLTITRAAATVTQSPEKISPRANHLTSTTAPAISPATIPAKNRQQYRQTFRHTSRRALPSPRRRRPRKRRQEREAPHRERSSRRAQRGSRGLGKSATLPATSARIPAISPAIPVSPHAVYLFVQRRRGMRTFPLSNPLPGMFLTCADAIAHLSK